MTTPQQMQNQVLDYMKQGQQAALQLADTMTTTRGAGLGPTGRDGDPPGLFPGAAEFVDQMFDFWVQLFEAQRALAHSWIATVAPGELAAGPLVDRSARTAPTTPNVTASSAPVVDPASSAPARTAASTADEKVSAAASDAVARAAGLTAAKTRS